MSKKVYIPFLSIFEKPMLAGTKTTTARTRKYGQPGDTFTAWGATFEIREIVRVFLSTVRDKFYQQEGFSHPDEFVAIWKRLHTIRGFNPEQAVYLHSFRKLEGVRNES